jgi:endonuclease/exonuclease/phosphatase family metal-dependent hydrolase
MTHRIVAGFLLAAACVPFIRKDSSLRVLVLNIHAGKDAAGKDNIADLAALIRTARADIVLLQEVDRGTNRSGKVDQVQTLIDAGTGTGSPTQPISRASASITCSWQGGSTAALPK